MKLNVKTPFSWAHRGVDVKHYEAGDEIDTTDEDLIEVSTREKWVDSSEKGEKRASKAMKNAPENKSGD